MSGPFSAYTYMYAMWVIILQNGNYRTYWSDICTVESAIKRACRHVCSTQQRKQWGYRVRCYQVALDWVIKFADCCYKKLSMSTTNIECVKKIDPKISVIRQFVRTLYTKEHPVSAKMPPMIRRSLQTSSFLKISSKCTRKWSERRQRRMYQRYTLDLGKYVCVRSMIQHPTYVLIIFIKLWLSIDDNNQFENGNGRDIATQLREKEGLRGHIFGWHMQNRQIYYLWIANALFTTHTIEWHWLCKRLLWNYWIYKH